VPGLGDLAARRTRLASMLKDAKRSTKRTAVGTEHRIGAGRFLVASDVDAALATTAARREPAADRGLRVLRRAHGEGHHLFLANLGKDAVDGWVPFADAAASAVVLDPRDGARGVADVRRRDGGLQVRLRLEPGESLFVRTFASRRVHGRRWATPEAGGEALRIRGPWELSFVGRDGKASKPRKLDRLQSWTQLGSDAEAFSGTARYTVRFDRPKGKADEWVLDLGDVRESARVTINGTELRTAWSLPFRVPVGDALKRGENVLEVEVTNLAANEVRALSKEGAKWDRYYIVSIEYEDFEPAKWKPMPSGLLGPVRLVPQRIEGPPRA
jgi:hypothetical protein